MVAKFHRAKLKDLRIRAGLTQANLARRIGISRHFVLEVENSHRDPSYATMIKWLHALDADGSLDLFEELSRNEAWRPQKRNKPQPGAARKPEAQSTKADAAEVA
jgi:transcriptional regulator with XRE-family HTH domain